MGTWSDKNIRNRGELSGTLDDENQNRSGYKEIKMIISEKQIFELMNVARMATLKKYISPEFVIKIANLIYEIETQQSKELKEIK